MTGWHVIARKRQHKWVPEPDARCEIPEARHLFDHGMIDMAQRRGPHGDMELLIWERRVRDHARHKFFKGSASQ